MLKMAIQKRNKLSGIYELVSYIVYVILYLSQKLTYWKKKKKHNQSLITANQKSLWAGLYSYPCMHG